MANIHIPESWKVSKHSFKAVLAGYTSAEAMEVKAHRSSYSLRCEMATHNALYRLGLWRSHTEAVDLNFPNRWAWAYCIVGTLVYPFIP